MSSEHSNSVVFKQNEPSLCIPRTFSNITWKKVKETFEQLFGQGCVERVDVVKKTHENGDTFNRIFIHFKYWPEKSEEIRQRFLNGQELKIVYDEPWFWKCSMSRVAKPSGQKPTGQKRNESRRPYITSFETQRDRELTEQAKRMGCSQLAAYGGLDGSYYRKQLEEEQARKALQEKAMKGSQDRSCWGNEGGDAIPSVVSENCGDRPACCSPRHSPQHENVAGGENAAADA